MQSSTKYLIHAEVRTSGVVERSDVVGAIFGQTEGLLGEELDLRDLQESSKVGRIDVEIESEGGRSYGSFTIASSLDRVETAVLAASLETIERVGPSRAECSVTEIEDARAAKRREVVDRATALLTEFQTTEMTGDTLIDAVRKRARVDELVEFEGLPAGPRVAESDAIIVVEGRADVKQLLKYGIRNAIAVEGTNIPKQVADLTHERNTTVFLDGDRGGELILRELEQIGQIDYVAFAPENKSVEDLDRSAVRTALRKKIPFEQITDGTSAREAFSPTDGGTIESVSSDGPADNSTVDTPNEPQVDTLEEDVRSAITDTEPAMDTGKMSDQPPMADTESEEMGSPDQAAETAATGGEAMADSSPATSEAVHDSSEQETSTDESKDPQTLAGHVEAVIGDELAVVRLLDKEFDCFDESPASEIFETLAESEEIPHSVVVDGTITQRILDIAAQRGIQQIVGLDTDEFVKQPTSVRVRVPEEFELKV